MGAPRARCSPPGRGHRRSVKKAAAWGPEEKPPASNGELRGGKGSLHEGGVRVPTIFYWSAKLKSRTVNEPLAMVDVMPTVLALAGAEGSPDHPFDGKDIWLTLAGGERSSPEDILINVEAIPGL
jgi:arylsulfatase A-like enzyme